MIENVERNTWNGSLHKHGRKGWTGDCRLSVLSQPAMSERCLFAIALHSILLADEYTIQAISLPYSLLFLLRTDGLIVHFELWMYWQSTD
jgi:hypothetical protein